ncbi:MAG: histidine kinase [Chitinophagaceae bacterium]|nr:histidine kinase [Chitinophagaceae bacterium]
MIIAVLLFIATTSYGQIWDYSYTHYGKEDGLPSNTVYCMTSDKDGLLWIGTDAGLCSFDGFHFTTYTTDHGLPSNDIFNLFCDSQNRIWITSMSKEACYMMNGRIYNKKNDSLLGKIKIPNRISKIFEENTNIFILSFPFDVNIIEQKNISHYSLKLNNTFPYKSYYSNNTIYFITNNGIYSFRINNKSFHKLNSFDQKTILDIIIFNDSLYTINENNIIEKCSQNIDGPSQDLISLTHSKVLFKDTNDIWVLFTKGIKLIEDISKPSNQSLFLENTAASYFIEDKFSNLWVSSLGNGFYKINSKYSKIFYPSQSSTSNKITSVNSDGKEIVIGNQDGQIVTIDKNSISIKYNLKIPSPLSYRILKTICIDNNNYTISTDVGTFNYNKIKKSLISLIKNRSCKNHFINKNRDSLIILTNTSIIFHDLKKNIQKEISLNRRLYSYIQYNSQILIGAEDGLYTLKDTCYNPFFNKDKFPYRVMDLKQFNNDLIAATIEKGIYIIGKNDIINNISIKNGLSSNKCNKMSIYKDQLFIATNNGVNIYDFQTDKINTLFESDGLASNNVNDLTVLNDTLYAATDNGLSIIPLSHISNNKQLPIYIKPIFIRSDTLYTSDTVLSTRTDYPLSLQINALSFLAKGPIHYYYQLGPLQKNFTRTTDQIIPVNFNSPGTYNFRAFAEDINGHRSRTLNFTINVLPYFWQTTTFRLIALLLGVVVILYAGYIFLQKIKHKEALKRANDRKLHELELSVWRSKINPHFLFNALNTLQSLFSLRKFEEANNYLTNFTKILRKTIEHSGKSLINIVDECDYLNHYLGLEKIKSNHPFEYQVTVHDPELNAMFIPALVIQPVIENSLKHGLSKGRKGLIKVDFSLTATHIECRISDNGKGYSENTKTSNGQSFGLKLVLEKLHLVEQVAGEKTQYSFVNTYNEDGQITGTLTTFIFPILKSKMI